MTKILFVKALLENTDVTNSDHSLACSRKWSKGRLHEILYRLM